MDFETALIFKPRYKKSSDFARVPAPTSGYSGKDDFAFTRFFLSYGDFFLKKKSSKYLHCFFDINITS